MRASVAVTLIVMGALIIMTPPASDYLHQRQVVSLMAKSETVRVTLQGLMSDTYRLGCWFAGVIMVLMAVLGSFRRISSTDAAEKN